jgi:hypothetical protein
MQGNYGSERNRDVLSLTNAFNAFTGDVVMEYCFGFCDSHLESPGFKVNFHRPLVVVSAFGALASQFPFIHPVSNRNCQ